MNSAFSDRDIPALLDDFIDRYIAVSARQYLQIMKASGATRHEIAVVEFMMSRKHPKPVPSYTQWRKRQKEKCS